MTGFDDRFGAAPAPSGPPAPSGSSGVAGCRPDVAAVPLRDVPALSLPRRPARVRGRSGVRDADPARSARQRGARQPYRAAPAQDVGRPADRQRGRRRHRGPVGAQLRLELLAGAPRHRGAGQPRRRTPAHRHGSGPGDRHGERRPQEGGPRARRSASPSMRRPRPRTSSCWPASAAGSRASSTTWPAAEPGRAPRWAQHLRTAHGRRRLRAHERPPHGGGRRPEHHDVDLPGLGDARRGLGQESRSEHD